MFSLHNICTAIDTFTLEVGHQVLLGLMKLKPTSEETPSTGHSPLLLLIWPAKGPEGEQSKRICGFLQGNAQKCIQSLLLGM